MLNDTSRPGLGRFDLDECIGRGGMGEVYRAHHTRTGVPVAVKVIRGDHSDESTTSFDLEIQAHAGLVHPGVVYLFDYGVIDEDTAARWERLTPDSPFVVMELADGTVRDLLPIDDWSTMRSILLQVLAALAFAHARGVIHRDLKPENFLLFDTDQTPASIKLADFGIAHAFDREAYLERESLEQSSGTPYFMPPEQFHGAWRSYGPWTDLYALGCIAWKMVCGRPPFEAKTPFALGFAHCESPRPELEPRITVPDGLESWIHRAMAIEPTRRFQSAAEAARALPGADTSATSRGLRQDWRVAEPTQIPTPLIGTGLGLFGLRDVPFVDRDKERDVMWKALRRVQDDQHFEMIVIAGEVGAGKSRLVRWMTRRSHELGAAAVLKAVHTDGEDNPTEGLAGLVARHFHTWNLPRGALYTRLLEQLPALDASDDMRDFDARALTELIHPSEDDAEVDGPRFRFRNPRVKYSVLTRLLERVARRGLPLVWLDDLQWGAEGLSLVEYLCDNAESAPPCLLLVTVRHDVIDESSARARRVEALTQYPFCTRLDLESLAARDHRLLIDQMLPLEPSLADDLAARTEGNPLFAHQLLSAWIAEEALELGEEGFEIVGDGALEIPNDIHDLWMSRIAHLFATYPPSIASEAVQGLELAATLGREIERAEWDDLHELADLTLPPTLFRDLVDRGLAQRTDEGWAFAHGLLVDSIRRRAAEEGRLKDHHRRCAEMLEQRYPAHHHRSARRRADHWIAAGELKRALQPLLDAEKRLAQLSETEQREQTLRAREHVLDQLGAGPDDPRRLENDLRLHHLRFWQGHSEEGRRALTSTLQQCKAVGDPVLVANAHWRLSSCFIGTAGDLPEAARHLRELLRIAREVEDPLLEGRALSKLGMLSFMRGQPRRGKESCEMARQLLRQAGATREALGCDRTLAFALMDQGDFENARQLLRDVQSVADEYHFGWFQAECANGLGEMARFEKRYDEALKHYLRYESLVREMSHGEGQTIALLNLGLAELGLGRFDKALRYVDDAEKRVADIDGGRFRESFDCVRLAVYCGTEQWEEFDRRFAAYAGGWPGDRPLNRDHPWLLEIAADFATRAGYPGRARKLRRLARTLWERLGNDEATARLDTILADTAKPV